MDEAPLRAMKQDAYYLAYERRYRLVREAGGEGWGHTPDDADLSETLAGWVSENGLAGRRVIECACGEGASGVILSRLGCAYSGFDIAPTAVEAAQEALAAFPKASAALGDMTEPRPGGPYDAALDVMGFHMLVVDADRTRYLHILRACLKPGAPVLFFRESHRENAYDGPVESFDAWLARTGDDYETPGKRTARRGDGEVDVWMPLVPARAKTVSGYRAELEAAGFSVESILLSEPNTQCPFSVNIRARAR